MRSRARPLVYDTHSPLSTVQTSPSTAGTNTPASDLRIFARYIFLAPWWPSSSATLPINCTPHPRRNHNVSSILVPTNPHHPQTHLRKKERLKRRPQQSNRNRMIPLPAPKTPTRRGKEAERRYAAYCTEVIVPSPLRKKRERKTHTIFAPAPIAPRRPRERRGRGG
ncbi:hypothetical protein BDY17DRAFT_153081 [Neohortaea acidophila]|uniref:Uncharacterized protein n=1 Tax=Neohortaea acidophila TaxID=245834 RepID=A0A6A6PVG6_9PEZI|nr:uncharacterized protein BDY17DRAFT_153081 [Neohortaea acidophila]KAF2483721.1 hypothetical protein BDY17DRAFT_153081 [Neohortaea acidophila]